MCVRPIECRAREHMSGRQVVESRFIILNDINQRASLRRSEVSLLLG